jgi:hypothetical protein
LALKNYPGRAVFTPTLAVVALALAMSGSALAASPGGVDPHPSAVRSSAGTPAEEEGCVAGSCAPIQRARIVNGEAIAPAGAPAGVQLIIATANKIRTKPYLWGGGHGRWADRGYDCSGAVSFALHGAKLLSTPLDSTSFEGWGTPGPGRWVTVYANAGHAYAVIAGLRLDTSAAGDPSDKDGPQWRPVLRNTKGFKARHLLGF